MHLRAMGQVICRWLARDRQNVTEAQQALERAVRERTAQLETLASHLQDVSETEKSRLARELHDELGAILTASRMDIAWVKGKLSAADAPLAEKLERAIKHLDQGIQAKRRIIEDLRPTTLVTFGLTTAVQEYAEQVREQAGWELQLDLPDTDPQLPESDTIALFRILQESLTNVSKSACASRVRISFTCDSNAAKLEVEDNGIGFRPGDARPNAHGLLGIRQRINARGGSLEVRSEPGQGTLVCAVMPVRKPGHDDAS